MMQRFCVESVHRFACGTEALRSSPLIGYGVSAISPIGTHRAFLDCRVLASRIELSGHFDGRGFEMKAFVAACIAAGILWGVDVKLNDGRYSVVVQNVVVGALPK